MILKEKSKFIVILKILEYLLNIVYKLFQKYMF